jgi:hypothetical protein
LLFGGGYAVFGGLPISTDSMSFSKKIIPDVMWCKTCGFHSSKIQVVVCGLWHCSDVKGYQCFGGPCSFHLHNPEDHDLNLVVSVNTSQKSLFVGVWSWVVPDSGSQKETHYLWGMIISNVMMNSSPDLVFQQEFCHFCNIWSHVAVLIPRSLQHK